jgi:transposase
MTTLPWTATASEQVRLLAMLRLAEGWSRQEVCEFLGVSRRSITRWLKSLREGGGAAGLLTKPRCGRPPKLDDAQAAQVLAWLERGARDFGFATDRWTAPRVAAVVEERFAVRFNARYLNDWLGRRGVTPQMPQRQPRERDQALIDAWVRHDWPRVKKRRVICTRPLVLRTKAGFCWHR